ncbi:MAG: hypothetical protein ABI427_17660 [Solirubrobacteraceae bacterium]
MTVLPTLSGELTLAADRLARRSAARRHQARAGSALAVGALGLAGVAAGATGLWNPQLGDARRGQPTSSASQPPAEQLARFGVLRRASTDADRGAETQYALKLLDPSFHGVRSAYVRLVGTEANGGGYVLIPVQSYTPAGVNAPASTDALCLFARDPVDGGGGSCSTTQQILQGRAVDIMPTPAPGPVGSLRHRADGSSYFQPNGRIRMIVGAVTIGLVPDGVAQVRLTNSYGTVTADVHDNFYDTALPNGAAGSAPHPVGGPLTTQWLASDGHVVPRGS